MPTRTGLLLALTVLAAVGAMLWMVLGDDFGDSGDEFTRDGRAEDGADALTMGDTRLEGASSAVSAEEREAARAAREAAARAPTTPRAQSVFGRVTTARGAGIAGATVRLMIARAHRSRWGLPDPEAIATATSDAQGNYLLGPAPEGRLQLRAEAPGYAPTVRPVNRRGYRVDVILDRGGALDVLVKDAKGAPIESARVIHQESAGTVVTDATTDAQGLAHFPGLPTGSGILFASAEGHAGVTQGDVGVAPGRTEKRTIVLGSQIVVEGRVLDAETDAPVQRARVLLRYPSMPWIEEPTVATSDEDGRFEASIPLPLGRTMDVEVLAAAYGPTRAWYTSADSGGGRMTLEIKLSGGRGGVRGEVLDHRGRPIAGVRVAYVTERDGQEAPETKSRGDGTFTLPPVPWASRRGSRVQVMAVSESAGIGQAWAALSKSEEPGAPVSIRLTGSGTVTGRVLDGAGEAVAGALVALGTDWGKTWSARRAPGAPHPAMIMPLLRNARFVRLDAITDAGGNYTIAGVPPAWYTVRATFGLEAGAGEEAVEIAAGGSANQDVTLGGSATIEGSVVDPDGAPVVGAHVSASPEAERGRATAPQLSARSQEDGRFVIHGASQASYAVRAGAAGFQSKHTKSVQPGSTDTTLVLQPLGWIEGVVTYEGRPYQGTFSVRARPVAREAPRPGQLGRPFRGGGAGRNTFNTDDGRFRLRGLEGGEYDLGAQTPEGLITSGVTRTRVALGRGTTVNLVLSGGGQIEGTLVEDSGGEAIRNASVSVRPIPGADGPVSTAHARTDPEGRFVLRGLQTGAYGLNILPPSGIRIRMVVEVRAGDTQVIRIRAQAPGEVLVTARDTGGNPLAGARPRLKTETGDEEWPSWSTLRQNGVDVSGGGWNRVIQTDANGTNLRRFVPVGRYEVRVDLSGYRTVEPVWVEVAAGRTTEVEIVLERIPDESGG